jgi:hypothetical protein
MSLVIFFIRLNGAVFLAYGLLAHLLPRNRLVGVRFSYTLADGEIWRAVQGRARWPVFALGVPCVLVPLLVPLSTLPRLLSFAAVLLGLLGVVAVASYRYARRLYAAKYGTTEVVSKGWFRYEPPAAARDALRGGIGSPETPLSHQARGKGA